MQVHIGKKIKERLSELRMSPAYLAERINTTRQNIYGIFRRKSIDTDLLQKISTELEFDFFTYYKVKSTDKEKYVNREEFEDLWNIVKEIRIEIGKKKK